MLFVVCAQWPTAQTVYGFQIGVINRQIADGARALEILAEMTPPHAILAADKIKKSLTHGQVANITK